MKLSELQEEMKADELLLSKLRLIKVIGNIRDLGFNNASLDNINNTPVQFTKFIKRDFFEACILSALFGLIFTMLIYGFTKMDDNLIFCSTISLWVMGIFIFSKLLMLNREGEEKNIIISLIKERDILFTKLNVES